MAGEPGSTLIETDRTGRGRYLAIYLAASLPICFLLTWRTDLISMEGIIGLVARNMRQSGDWVVPRLYGDIYAYKPPMVYWMAAGSEAIFGRQSEFALRLPTGLSGLGLGLALFSFMGAIVSPRCGLYCALAATTSGVFAEQAGMAGFDMPLTLGSTLAILAACRNLSSERCDWRYWALGYIGLWFAFMSKGIPALVVYAPGLLAGAWVIGRVGRLFRWPHLLGAALFLAGTAIYLCRAYQVAGTEGFEHRLDDLMLRSSRFGGRALWQTVQKPFIIAGIFLPWSAAIIYAAIRQRQPFFIDAAARTWRMAWAFLITGLVIYLIVTTHDTRYYLPLLGPAAMVAGMALERLPPPHGRRVAVIFTAIGVCFWITYAGLVQPRRAKKRSLRDVAAAFAPHVPRDATVYIDAGVRDNYSSLFFYLQRDVEHWRWPADQPEARGYVVLFGEKDRPARPPPGLACETVVSVAGPDRKQYVLARVTSGEP